MTTTHRSRTGTYPEEGIKAPCVVAAVINITLSGEQTVNSVACVAADRVLTTAQTDPTENGIWVCAVGAWSRSSDWSDARDVASGILITVPGATYQATFTGDFVAGTTSITITKISSTDAAADAAAAAASAAAALVSENNAATSETNAGISETNAGDSETAAAASAATAAAYAIPSVQTLTSSSGVVTINVSSDYVAYTLTLTENVTSWSFTNLPASGKFKDIFVKIVQHASSAKTVVSPATTAKTAGGAWTVSSTVSSEEVLGLRVFSDGTKELYPSGVFA